MNTDRLISLKENFTGQKFQWIKTDRIELLGKVVRCRDIEPLSNGRFIAMFDDGSRIDTEQLNSSMLMLHGDMQPLSKSEVEAIYQPKAAKSASPKPSVVAPQPEIPVNPPISDQPQQTISQAPVAPTVPKTNMFAMFNSEEGHISVNLKVKLPDKKLLKMMYLSADNKDKFLDELSEYLHAMINNQVVKESVKLILDPPIIKKEAKPAVNLREVDEQ